MQRGDQQFTMRMPLGMRDQIAALAKAAGRSMNSEIVVRLAESMGMPIPAEAARNDTARREQLMLAALPQCICMTRMGPTSLDPRLIAENAYAIADALLAHEGGAV